MSDDDAAGLRDVAAAQIADRKLLVMLTSFLVGAGVLTLDLVQDCLLEEAEEQRRPGQPDPELGALAAAELTRLAQAFDPSVLPLRPRGPSTRRPRKGR